MPPRHPVGTTDEHIQIYTSERVEQMLKTPWRDGTTHLVMSPPQLMQRLAALAPRPRLHLLRFHGVRGQHAVEPEEVRPALWANGGADARPGR